jgi:hypothetical protein
MSRSELAGRGKILLTGSAGKQASSTPCGKGLQPVEEVITLEDLLRLAADVNDTVTCFNSISVWEVNDYLHTVIDADRARPIADADCSPIMGWLSWPFWRRGGDPLIYRPHGMIQLREHWPRRWFRRWLSGGGP